MYYLLYLIMYCVLDKTYSTKLIGKLKKKNWINKIIKVIKRIKMYPIKLFYRECLRLASNSKCKIQMFKATFVANSHIIFLNDPSRFGSCSLYRTTMPIVAISSYISDWFESPIHIYILFNGNLNM